MDNRKQAQEFILELVSCFLTVNIRYEILTAKVLIISHLLQEIYR